MPLSLALRAPAFALLGRGNVGCEIQAAERKIDLVVELAARGTIVLKPLKEHDEDGGAAPQLHALLHVLVAFALGAHAVDALLPRECVQALRERDAGRRNRVRVRVRVTREGEEKGREKGERKGERRGRIYLRALVFPLLVATDACLCTCTALVVSSTSSHTTLCQSKARVSPSMNDALACAAGPLEGSGQPSQRASQWQLEQE
jgi:hypothetical protein